MSNSSAFLLRDILIRNDQLFPNNTAMFDGDVAITYRELFRRINRARAVLGYLGIRPGDRVGILMENNAAYIELLLAVAHMGSIAVPLNTRLTADELQFILNDAEASLLITSSAFKHLAEATYARLSSVTNGLIVDSDTPEGQFQSYKVVQAETEAAPKTLGGIGELSEDSTAILVYTSGTTGSPKGCMTTQRSWIGNSLNMAIAFSLSTEDRYLALLPFFHVGGLGALFAQLHAGGTVIPMAKYSATGVVQMIEKYRISVAFLVPPMVQQVLTLESREQYDLNSLRIVIGAAGFEPPWVSARVEDDLHAKFYGIYGQTESGNIVASATRNAIASSPSTYGRELPAFRVRIVDDSDEEVPVGSPGELTLRGPSVMSGYWRREEATRKALRGDWLHTGDIFVRHPDGTLEMVDRKTYIIKTGGENVYPAEVEHVLAAHPSVADVCVIGIPDPVWGETVKACIVLRLGHAPSRSELVSWCREHVAAYKAPRYIEWVEEIPRSHSGKPLKDVLKARPTHSTQGIAHLE